MENELCYYCNLSTFKSIIQNQTFWLSDLHYMNDSAEESWFLDALSDVMREFRDALSDETKEYLDKNKYMDDYFKNIKYNYKNFAYICCFTDGEKNDQSKWKCNDDLSQWRGYAADGTGLCIGFKKDSIVNLLDNLKIEKLSINEKSELDRDWINTKFAQKGIQYLDKDEIMGELEEIVAPIVEKYDKADKKTLSPPFPNAVFANELYEQTFKYKVFYKNKSFKSENEYRICFYDKLHEGAIGVADKALMENMQERYRFENGTTLSELKYREGRGNLIPYREMKFTHSFFQEMLSSVTIGPKNPMTKNDVKYFLIANGFDTKNIKVEKSASTYQ